MRLRFHARTRNGRLVAAGVALAAATLSLAAAPAPGTAAASSTFVIAGRGWGHGVGMSQYGAEGFARAGYSYRDILGNYYGGAGLGRAPDVPVRVLLGDGRPRLGIASRGPIAVRDAGGRSFAIPAGSYVLRGDLVIAAVGRRVALRAPVRFDAGLGLLQLDGRAYRGQIVVRRGAGGLTVVNELPVELYLRGVVPDEMPSGWHVEALRAQAVAARSYALASLVRGGAYDLYPDTRSQMYGGVAAERPATNRAVASTAGEVVAWQGRIARTYYHAASGGCTASAADGFGSASRLPYLVTAQDPYDWLAPEHRWGPIRLSASDLGGRLGLPALTGVRVRLNPSGRVAEVAAEFPGGRRTIAGATFARDLGLPSTWFAVGDGGVTPPVGAAGDCPARSAPAPAPAPAAAAPKPRQQLAPKVPAIDAPALAAGLVTAGIRAAAALPVPLRLAAAAALKLVDDPAVLVQRLVAALPRSVPPAPAALPVTALPRPAAPEPARALPPLLEPVQNPAPVAGAHDTAPAAEPSITLVLTDPSAAAGPTAAVKAGPADPLEITDVSIVSVDGAGARVTWRTTFPARVQGGRGTGDAPTVWTDASGPELQHETLFTGLADSADYTLWLRAEDAWGRATVQTLHVTTPPSDGAVGSAATAAGTIRLDGRPYFPLMVWETCGNQYPELTAAGLNLFMGDGCMSATDQLAQLTPFPSALSAVPAGSTATGRGLIGSYLQDELDGRLPAFGWQQQLQLLPPPVADRVSFLTLTNHFYSRAAPLEIGRDVYPALVGKADVIGFDLYPLQEWCNANAIGDVFDAQRELVQLAGGKPTFQWIEARQMKCGDPANAVTPATVRAETWLAIAGGANGIGYFPNNWTPEVGAEITRTNGDIRALAAALLAPPAASSADSGTAVRVGARSLGGALYIVAVNPAAAPASATIRVPGLAGRALTAYGESRTVPASGDAFSDSFAPLEVHVYVVPPSGWGASAAPAATAASDLGAAPASPAPPAPEATPGPPGPVSAR